jgi:hypothetical protein
MSTQPRCSIDLAAGGRSREPDLGPRAAEATGETNRAVERVVQLFVDRRRSATSAAANPALDTASRRFREPLLLPLERAGPEDVADAAAAAPRPGTFANRDTADPAPQSTCHRGSSCPS